MRIAFYGDLAAPVEVEVKMQERVWMELREETNPKESDDERSGDEP